MPILRYVFDVFINPFTILFYLMTLGVLRACLYQFDVLARILLIAAVVLLVILSTAWLPRWVLYNLQRQYPIVTKINPDIHWVVVLSGGQNIDESLAPPNFLLNSITINRLLEGVRIYNKLPAATLLLSGSAYHVSMNEAIFLKHIKYDDTDAVHMSILAAWFKIPSANMVIDLNAINTADEAVAVKKILDNEPFYLVTSALHMPRSMTLFLKQGLHPVAAPSDYPFYWERKNFLAMFVPNPGNLAIANNVWHEYMGLIWDKICAVIHLKSS